MSLYVLDTCVLSEISKPRPAASVLAWLDANFSRCVLSSPVLMELVSGVVGSREESQRSRRNDILLRIVDRFPPERRAVFDEAAARAAGQATAQAKRAGKPLAAVDAQIIGLARTLNGAVVTRDSDFTGRGVDVINPWIET